MNKSKYKAPSHLERFVTYENEEYFDDFDLSLEWRGQMQSLAKNKKFRIKFYGDLFKENDEDTGLIIGDDFSEALIVAQDIKTNEEILLFDGCKHGYDAMFCDEYSKEQIENRDLKNTYKDKNGNEIFEVVVGVYYNIDYDEEMEDFLNEDNEIELLSGEKISEDELKRDGFDCLFIYVYNEKGEKIEIAQYELA